MPKKTQKETKKDEPLRLVKIDKEKPTRPCYRCFSNNWWQRADGGWVCGSCHPDPNKPADIKPKGEAE